MSGHHLHVCPLVFLCMVTLRAEGNQHTFHVMHFLLAFTLSSSDIQNPTFCKEEMHHKELLLSDWLMTARSGLIENTVSAVIWEGCEQSACGASSVARPLGIIINVHN